MPQIRLNKTPELEKVLIYLRSKYCLLSEAEIIKVVLSEKYYNELENSVGKEQKLRDAYNHAMVEGKKVGIRLMKEKGLDPKKVTDQEFYDTFLDTRKHKA